MGYGCRNEEMNVVGRGGRGFGGRKREGKERKGKERKGLNDSKCFCMYGYAEVYFVHLFN